MTAQLMFSLLQSAAPNAAPTAVPAGASAAPATAVDFASLLHVSCGAQASKEPVANSGTPPLLDHPANVPGLALGARTSRDQDDEQNRRRTPIAALPSQTLASAVVVPPVTTSPCSTDRRTHAGVVGSELDKGISEMSAKAASFERERPEAPVQAEGRPWQPSLPPGAAPAAEAAASADEGARAGAETSFTPKTVAASDLTAASPAASVLPEAAAALTPAAAPAPALAPALAPAPAPSPAPAPAPAPASASASASASAAVAATTRMPMPLARAAMDPAGPLAPSSQPAATRPRGGQAAPAHTAPQGPAVTPPRTPPLPLTRAPAQVPTASATDHDPAPARSTASSPASSDAASPQVGSNGTAVATSVAARPADDITATHSARGHVSVTASASVPRNNAHAAPAAQSTTDTSPRSGDPIAPVLQPLAGPADANAKTMTAVTKASHTAEPVVSPAGAKLRDAFASVANQAVLRGPATGQINVPELGRVVVRAHNVGGAVDVDVSADRSDARVTLRGHVSAMATDLRQADVPLARLTVDRAHDAFGQSTGSSPSFRDRDPQAHDSPRDNAPRAEEDSQPLPTEASVPRRVRIVL